jgi:hypothetical protein
MDDLPFTSSLLEYHRATSSCVRKIVKVEGGDGSVAKELNTQINWLEA